MLRPTRQFPIPKPIMSGVAMIVVLIVLGGIYFWDVSRTDTLTVPARLEGGACDSDGVECRLVRGGETKVQLKNCDESDELCKTERYAISEKDGGVEVYSLKSEKITFIDQEIVIDRAEVGEYLYGTDSVRTIESAAAMATECEVPEEGEILGAECYELDLPENLRESETEERRKYVDLRDRVKSYFETP